MKRPYAAVAILALFVAGAAAAQDRARARDLGLSPGVLAPGPLNAITDVAGVRVGQVTLIEGDSIRTGVTAILPHGGNLFQDKVPAGLSVANGFGKLAGVTQVRELGEIETPILLTNTLSVPAGMAGAVDWTLDQPGNEQVRSVNAVVGETNDGGLNDIRARRVTPAEVRAAIENAVEGPVQEGSVGAGTGTIAFGWKGGIGTSSRRLPESLGGWTVGVLVQSNFGGALVIDGHPVGERLEQYYLREAVEGPAADGSIMIVIATDAPLSDRNLERLAGGRSPDWPEPARPSRTDRGTTPSPSRRRRGCAARRSGAAPLRRSRNCRTTASRPCSSRSPRRRKRRSSTRC